MKSARQRRVQLKNHDRGHDRHSKARSHENKALRLMMEYLRISLPGKGKAKTKARTRAAHDEAARWSQARGLDSSWV